MAKAVVTGGSGFIGSSLVRVLLNEGFQVRVLSLPKDRNENLKDLSVEIVRGDIRDPSSIETVFEGFSHIFHLAGTPQLWLPRRRAYYENNVLGTMNVIRAAMKSSTIERFIYTSTESIVGPSTSEGPCTEKTVSRLSQMVGPYCRSKFIAEQEVLNAVPKGLPVIVVNPTLPVGPGDIHLTPPGKMIVNFLQGKLRRYIHCGLNLVDVRDVARGHLLAARYGKIGERYILGGENITLKNILDILSEISGVPSPKKCVPWRLALIFSYIAEFTSDHFTRSSPISNVTGVKLARYFMYFDSSKAIKELKFHPYPIRKALEDAVQWFREKGYVS